MRKIRIDTSNNRLILVELWIEGKKKDSATSDSKIQKAEAVLPLIDRLLKRNSLLINDLEGIDVFEGPGSFTGLRVGISIANALGSLLKVPINGRKIGEMANPVYN